MTRKLKYGLLILIIMMLMSIPLVVSADYPVLSIENAKNTYGRAVETTWADPAIARASRSTAESNILIYEELQKQTELLRQIEINTRD